MTPDDLDTVLQFVEWLPWFMLRFLLHVWFGIAFAFATYFAFWYVVAWWRDEL